MCYVFTYRISSNRRPGVYFLRDSADPAFKRGRRLFYFTYFLPTPGTHPRYVAHAEVEIHFSSCDRMAIKGVTGTLSSLLLEVHLEASLLCHRRSSRWSSVIPFGYGTGSTARCTWTTCHAPKLVRGRPGV